MKTPKKNYALTGKEMIRWLKDGGWTKTAYAVNEEVAPLEIIACCAYGAHAKVIFRHPPGKETQSKILGIVTKTKHEGIEYHINHTSYIKTPDLAVIISYWHPDWYDTAALLTNH
jgi:hypothetical protein